MAQSRPCLPGKRYHFHVIYNHANSPLSATQDNKDALEYTEHVVGLLKTIGFDESYYHKRDARAGGDIFSEMFRVLDQSGFTILILTRGFLESCWSQFCGKAAFKNRIDKGTGHRMIVLAFNIHDNEVPEELNHQNVSHFTGDPDVDADRWQCLKQEMMDGDQVQPNPHAATSERGDNRLHTDDQNLVAHPSDQVNLSDSINMEGDGASLMRNLSIDGDRGSRSMSGANGPMAPVHSDTQSMKYSRVNPGTQASSLGPPRREVSQEAQQNNSSSGCGELKTEVLQGREAVTADISQIPSPQSTRHVSSYTTMTLEASPTLYAPPVIKKPPSTSESKVIVPHHSTHSEMMSQVDTCPKVLPGDETVTGEINSGRDSLSQDDGLTLDYGSQIGVTRENDDQKTDDSQSKEDELAQNEEIPNVLLEKMFTDLCRRFLETDNIPKQLMDSGYSSEIFCTKRRQKSAHLDHLNTMSNAELITEVSESGLNMSASPSKDSIDMQNIEEIPEDENTTEHGQVPDSSSDKPPNEISEMATKKVVIEEEQKQNVCQVPDSSSDKPPNEISEMATKKVVIEEEQKQNACQVRNGSLDKLPNEMSELVTKEDVKEEEQMQSTCQVSLELTENRDSDNSLTEVNEALNDSNRVGSVEEMTPGSDEATGLAEGNMNEDSRSSIYRPAPEGEAADERIGNENHNGGTETAQSTESVEDPSKIHGSVGTATYNWMLFCVRSVCRTLTRTDALL